MRYLFPLVFTTRIDKKEGTFQLIVLFLACKGVFALVELFAIEQSLATFINWFAIMYCILDAIFLILNMFHKIKIAN